FLADGVACPRRRSSDLGGVIDAGEHAARLDGHVSARGFHEGVPELELLAPVALDACAVRREVPGPLGVLEARLRTGAVMTQRSLDRKSTRELQSRFDLV